jgi:hypothetical protein
MMKKVNIIPALIASLIKNERRNQQMPVTMIEIKTGITICESSNSSTLFE